jgi:anti-sigma regulatory factor (Ser/Thr protein kinase)
LEILFIRARPGIMNDCGPQGYWQVMVGLRLSPPPSSTVLDQWVLTDFQQLRVLRASLRRAVDAQAFAPGSEIDDVVERLAIIATELTTNALTHAQAPAVVRLSRSRTAFLLDVADNRPSAPPTIGEARTAGARGRGLPITQDLSLDTGWYVADGSKHVWAQIDIPRRIRRFHAPRIPAFGFTELVQRLRRIGS